MGATSLITELASRNKFATIVPASERDLQLTYVSGMLQRATSLFPQSLNWAKWEKTSLTPLFVCIQFNLVDQILIPAVTCLDNRCQPEYFLNLQLGGKFL